MTLKQYIVIMALATLLCFIALGFVVVNIDPFVDTGTGFGFFYLSLFFALLGTSSMISFLLRRLSFKDELPMFKYVQQSFRDAFFGSLFLMAVVYFQGKGYLNVWFLGGLILIILLLILFRITKSKNKEI